MPLVKNVLIFSNLYNMHLNNRSCLSSVSSNDGGVGDWRLLQIVSRFIFSILRFMSQSR